MRRGITRKVAEWAHNLKYEDIPKEVVEGVKNQLINMIATIYAGSIMESGQRMIEAVKTWGDKPESTVISGGYKTSMRNAAMVNSFLSCILEYEDYLPESHVGDVGVPTAFAVGESYGSSGKEIITSLVIGNEVGGRTGEVLVDPVHVGHASPNHTIDVPLIAGKLMGFEIEQLMDAVGIACTHVQGNTMINWAADCKGMLTGMPAYIGIISANLAKGGMSGSHEVLEHSLGYCNMASNIPDLSKLEIITKDLGKEWRTLKIVHKPFPVVAYYNAPIDAILKIVNNNKVDPEKVKEISIRCPFIMMLTAGFYSLRYPDFYEKIKNRRDWTYQALLIDGYYPMAISLVDKEYTPRQLKMEKILDPTVQELLKKIKLKGDPAVGSSAEVTITMQDGSSYTQFSKYDEFFHPEEGFDVKKKLYDMAEGIKTKEEIGEIISTIEKLEQIDNVNRLTELLA
ncbi:MAG: MmgE/PrpD family protein [Candidatus Lokiarchaeia archaeon]